MMMQEDINTPNQDPAPTSHELSFTDGDEPQHVENICRQSQQPEIIKLVRHSQVTLADIEPLFTPEKAPHIKEVHIENLTKITSTDVSLAFFIETFPNLQRLTFMSSSISGEERVPYSVWRQRGEELLQALQVHRSGNPLQLLKTNVLLPEKNFLRISASFVVKLELEHMPRAASPSYFTKGVLAHYDAHGGEYNDEILPRLGWTRHYSSEEVVEEFGKFRKHRGAMKLVGTKDQVYELLPPEVFLPVPSVKLHQFQLMSVSEDGFATLLDDDGTITEDTSIEPKWRLLLQQMLGTEEEVWLSFLHVHEFPTLLFAARGTSQTSFALLKA